MAEAKRPGTPKAIVDVAHPGKTPPSDTSKPVIVSNRPVLKDPMFVENKAGDDTEQASGTATSAKASTPMTLRPLNQGTVEATKSEKTDEAADEKSDTAVKDEKQSADTPASASEQTTEASAAQTEDAPKDSAQSDVPNSQQTDAAELDAEEAKQAEHDAAIQKLADSKQYFLPINSVEKQRSKRFVALGILLSLLLAIAWIDVALDAGLIQVGGIKPLTHFFSS